jgi:glycosyltransferase involved in cell wall biosynthesis
MLSISFIIPCYNGERFIFSNIKKFIEEIKKFKINYEIIIINDGSTDNTSIKLDKLQKVYKKIKFIHFKKNYGKSFSIRKGLDLSKFNHVVLLDADLPYFSYIHQIVFELKKGTDLVIVDRNHPLSILTNKSLSMYQFFRKNIGKLISKIIFYILNINLGTIDTQAGLKGFKKTTRFNKNKFISKNFFLDVELIYLFKTMNKKISLIPVKYKIEENSTINLMSIQNVQIFLDFIKVLVHLKFK